MASVDGLHTPLIVALVEVHFVALASDGGIERLDLDKACGGVGWHEHHTLAGGHVADIEVIDQDGFLVDTETAKEEFRKDIAQGIRQPWEYRVKFLGEDEETAKKMVAGEDIEDIEEEEDEDEKDNKNSKKKQLKENEKEE